MGENSHFGVTSQNIFSQSQKYFDTTIIYRVIKKEGPKVMGYYTTKKCILGAVEGLILTTSYQHFIIYIQVFKYFTLKLILRYLSLNINLAAIGYFRPTFASWLNQST